MNWKSVTRWVVIAGLLATAIYDLVALALGGEAATISRVVGIEGSFDAPTIPFAVGFVMGHLFWPQKRKASHDDSSE